ncbi:6931_t:CDS:2 [Entrophospora sp. SA101]|nr:6931_t:CDS:2 [Entrophospora sp. SA101]
MNPIETQQQTIDISEDNEPIFEDYDDETKELEVGLKQEAAMEEEWEEKESLKESLWNKFSETYHNGMKRTTFLKQIKDGPFIYHEDLGGLCSICCEFGYEVFDDLKKLISVHIVDKSNQDKIREIIIQSAIDHIPSKWMPNEKTNTKEKSTSLKLNYIYLKSIGNINESRTLNDHWNSQYHPKDDINPEIYNAPNEPARYCLNDKGIIILFILLENDKLQNGEMESIHYGFNQDRPQYELKSSFPILYAQMVNWLKGFIS